MELELKVIEWCDNKIKENTVVTRTEIRNYAKKLNNLTEFKATKSWVQLFWKRNSLNDKISKIISDVKF
jgi:hypothetical protein